jgi:hypothetical protein
MNHVLGMFLLSFLVCTAGAQTPGSLTGNWYLAGMIYRGQTIPPLNPNLHLRWTFFENGTERLYWDRQGEDGFCERFADYSLTGGNIQERTFAVNPKNRPDCGQDPDMQMGRETLSRLDIEPQQMLLHLPLGDEELIYILKEDL